MRDYEKKQQRRNRKEIEDTRGRDVEEKRHEKGGRDEKRKQSELENKWLKV